MRLSNTMSTTPRSAQTVPRSSARSSPRTLSTLLTSRLSLSLSLALILGSSPSALGPAGPDSPGRYEFQPTPMMLTMVRLTSFADAPLRGQADPARGAAPLP